MFESSHSLRSTASLLVGGDVDDEARTLGRAERVVAVVASLDVDGHGVVARRDGVVVHGRRRPPGGTPSGDVHTTPSSSDTLRPAMRPWSPLASSAIAIREWKSVSLTAATRARSAPMSVSSRS